MAEVGIVASALQIADIGIRLSFRIYVFGETIAAADKSIISISENVSLTSTVLKELGNTLNNDQTTRICSPNAMRTAENIVNQCQRIFQEMDHMLAKKFANITSAEKDKKIKSAQTLERLRWPFMKGKIDLLATDLERQKGTLLLMLNVIALAKQESERIDRETIIAEQRSLIQNLARSNEGYVHKFDQLKLSYPDVPMDQGVISADYNNSMPTPQALTAQGIASSSVLGAASQRGLSIRAQDFRPESYQGSYTFTPPPEGMSWMLQQYSDLLRSLLKEVSEPKYKIAEVSRSRIKDDIVTSHGREMRHTEHFGYSGVPSQAESGQFDVQHTPIINPAALNPRLPRAGKPELYSVHFRSMQPLITGLEYHSRTPSPSPPAMVEFHDTTRSEKEDDRPAQRKDRYFYGAPARRRMRKRRTWSCSPPAVLLRMAERSESESSRSPSYSRSGGSCITVQHSENESSRSRSPPRLRSLSSTVQRLEDESSDSGSPMSQCSYNFDLCEGHPSVTVPTFESGTRGRPRERFVDDVTEDSPGNVVEKLLATWTNLPVPASRTASD